MSESKFDGAGAPWSEAQWDEFLTRSELRAAKYRELLETLHAHPDCYTLVAHEMGWNHALERTELVDLRGISVPETAGERDDEPESPIFKRVQTSAMRISRILLHHLEAVGEIDTPATECLQEALGAVMEVPGRLAAADSLGTEDSVIGGNIALCRRAVQAVERLMDALIMAQVRGVLPASISRTLLAQAREIRNQVELHIATLRRGVWWE